MMSKENFWSAMLQKPALASGADGSHRMVIVQNGLPCREDAWIDQVICMCRGKVPTAHIRETILANNHLVLVYLEEGQLEQPAAVAYVSTSYYGDHMNLDLLCSSIPGAGASLVTMLGELSSGDRLRLFGKAICAIRLETILALTRYYESLGYTLGNGRGGRVHMAKQLVAAVG
jgi:hypothetical protein